MTKLYYKKVEKCSDCPRFSKLFSFCEEKNKLIDTTEIPDWCPLVDYTEKIEANETESVWLKIGGK